MRSLAPANASAQSFGVSFVLRINVVRDQILVGHRHICSSTGFFNSLLVSFRELAIGRNVTTPRAAVEVPLGRAQFRVQRSHRVYRALMDIKNMYVFSDTAAENLKRSRVCGIAVLEGADNVKVQGKSELHLSLKPLIIGIGGFGQSDYGWWDLSKGQTGGRSAL